MAQNIFEEASDNPIPPVDQMSPEQRGLFDLPVQLHAPRRRTGRRGHRGPRPGVFSTTRWANPRTRR